MNTRRRTISVSLGSMRQKKSGQRYVFLLAFILMVVFVLEMRQMYNGSLTEWPSQYKQTKSTEDELPEQDDTFLMYAVAGAFNITLSQSNAGLPLEMNADELLNKTTSSQNSPTDRLYRLLFPPNVSKSTHSDEESDIDKDESIDQNSVNEIYQGILANKVSSKPCNKETPRQKLVYLRTHRCGSSTMSNILYRYGEFNDLVFALPRLKSYQHYWPLRFQASHVDWGLIDNTRPNVINNAARYERKNLDIVMANNTFYFTVLREPASHFESIFEYVDFGYLFELWNTTNDPFKTFLKDPNKYISSYLNKTRYYNPELHLAQNAMSFDLGLEPEDYKDDKKIKQFIQGIEEGVDLVLILEYLDESLILLKTMLCWELDDIIYLRKKVRHNIFRNKIDDDSKRMIREWNRADVLIYDHFNQTLWNTLKMQSEEFWEEVDYLKNKVKALEEQCLLQVSPNSLKTNNVSFNIPMILKENIHPELEYLCQRLIKNEIEYVDMLKNIRRTKIKNQQKEKFDRKFYSMGSLDGNFYFEHENSTLQNKTDSLVENEAETVEEVLRDDGTKIETLDQI